MWGQKIHLNCKATSALRAICRFKWWLASVPFYNPNITHACYRSHEFALQFLNFYDTIGVVRVKQRHRENSQLLSSSSSRSGTKLDLIYALGTAVFHFRVVLYSPYRTTRGKKKSIYQEARKLETSLDVRWEDEKKVKEGERHPFSFVQPPDWLSRKHVFISVETSIWPRLLARMYARA